MKRFYLLFLAAVAAFAVTACGSKDDPEPGPGPGPSEGSDPVVSALTDATIAGTAIGAEMTVAGLITDNSTKKGVPGVPVTDGFTWVKTDANGVYQMKANARARKVYICTPAAYKIGQYSDGHPNFYPKTSLEAGKKYRVDFFLNPMGSAETNFKLMMIGDPQCSTTGEVARYVSETIKKIKSTCEGIGNVYAVTLGDVIFDSNDTYFSMYSSMSNVNAGNWKIPFFQCMGNHDHDATAVTASDREEKQYQSQKRFNDTFGPHDYSFDRGNAHIIVMDNVWVHGTSSSSKSNKKACDYYSGFTTAQMAWLTQDIANVQNPESKVVILCCHIPFRGGGGETTGSNFNKKKNYDEVLTELQKFGEAHIMIGHTHYPQNYIHTGRLTKNGKPIYEHIHGAACGGWWTSNSNVTGAPNGFAIYEANGGSLVNWQAMNSNFDNDFQLRVYDGNQEFTGTKGYKLSWYKNNTVSSFSAPGFSAAENSFVAEIWNDDDTNWTVEFWQNGSKAGNFTRAGVSGICNVPLVSYWFNEKGKTTDTWVNKTASHYWYYKPASGKPASETNWEVRAIQKIPTSGKTNTYTVNKLTTDYSTF